jgi:dTMP kinase
VSRGRFVVLEGGEGAGKSTNARFIQAWLQARGRRCLLTREPGGAPLAEAIRELVLGWTDGMPPQTELLLMFAARAAHLETTIKPALEAGTDVICDRFVDSTYAYQGAGRGLAVADIEALERMVVGEFRPDLVVVFDLEPEVGLARTRRRGTENRFENEALAFQQRVREVFLQRAQRQPQRYSIVDAGRELSMIQADLARLLEQRL